MGRLKEWTIPANTGWHPDLVGQKRVQCSTCGINYTHGDNHVPDSRDCIEMLEEKRWSQRD